MEQCSSCSSSRLIPNVRIIDRLLGDTQDLSVEVYENPDALIFKAKHTGRLLATICADCGHAELAVTNAADLYETYLKSRNR